MITVAERFGDMGGPLLRVDLLAQVAHQAEQSSGDALVPFGLAVPAALACISDGLPFDLDPVASGGRIDEWTASSPGDPGSTSTGRFVDMSTTSLTR
jgi:hypothetical protein